MNLCNNMQMNKRYMPSIRGYEDVPCWEDPLNCSASGLAPSSSDDSMLSPGCAEISISDEEYAVLFESAQEH